MALAYEGDNYRSKRSYISTGAFNSVIFQYTAQLNPTTLKNEGRLTAITTSPTGTALTATNCPAGRILREVGRKLYPGVNPGLAVGDTFSGAVVGTTATNKFWVLVFDAQTGVRGFIDPNAPTFALYNSDKSLEVIDAQENAGGAPARLGPALPATVTTQKNVLSAGTGTFLCDNGHCHYGCSIPRVRRSAVSTGISASHSQSHRRPTEQNPKRDGQYAGSFPGSARSFGSRTRPHESIGKTIASCSCGATGGETGGAATARSSASISPHSGGTLHGKYHE